MQKPPMSQTVNSFGMNLENLFPLSQHIALAVNPLTKNALVSNKSGGKLLANLRAGSVPHNITDEAPHKFANIVRFSIIISSFVVSYNERE